MPAGRLAALGITEASWSDRLRRGELLGFVAEDGTALVGHCFGNAATGEVVVLALLPSHESLGLGRRLLTRVVDGLRSRGHSRLFLGCSDDPSSRSHGFYRHLGWVPSGGRDQHGDEVLELHVPASETAHRRGSRRQP